MKRIECSRRSASRRAGRTLSNVNRSMGCFGLLPAISIAAAMVLSCGQGASRSIEHPKAEAVLVVIDADLEAKIGAIYLDGTKIEQSGIRAQVGQLSDGTDGTRFLFLEPGWGPHDVSVFLCDQTENKDSDPDVVIEIGRCVASPARTERQSANQRQVADGLMIEVLPQGGAVGVLRLNRLPKDAGSELVVQFDIQLDSGLGTVRAIKGDARFSNVANRPEAGIESVHPNSAKSAR